MGQVPLILTKELITFAWPINLDYTQMRASDRPTFQFKPPGDDRTYIGVAAPVLVAGQSVGAVMMAKPLADVNSAWTNVAGRVALGTGIGLLVAFVLAT